jgi:hypothetical protein
MLSLPEVLERFNRKERNLLVRDILGHTREAALPLSAPFRKKIEARLKISVPETAWWATDFHISWLAGALAVYVKQSTSPLRFPNPRMSAKADDAAPLKARQLVEGNQEDIDLVIAADQNLILIEAKAYGPFTDKQIGSKIARLDLLHRFYKELQPDSERRIQFHFLLQGPANPEHLKMAWPCWASNSRAQAWIPLELAAPESILEVTRCDSAGKSSAKGEYWKIYQSRVPPNIA